MQFLHYMITIMCALKLQPATCNPQPATCKLDIFAECEEGRLTHFVKQTTPK